MEQAVKGEAGGRVKVGGPYFEEFEVGAVFDAPALTLTSGHAAVHQALVGDRMRLPLDAQLSAEVTGRSELLAHPMLVCDVAIGQSTWPTQRVMGNLFYRGLVLQRPVFIGDTLRTQTEVMGLKQNRPKPKGPATGLIALRVRTENQHGEPVLDYVRCPMIPLRDREIQTGHADSFDEIPSELDMDRVREAVPDWSYEPMGERIGDPPVSFEEGMVFELDGRDTVTAAPEMSRLTLNVAKAHIDGGAGHAGRRLVYGGYTISMAAAAITRALPGLVTILAWHGCDHTGPVFEGDILGSEITVGAVHDLDQAQVKLVELRVIVHAHREGADEPAPVLDWRPVALIP